MNDVAKCRANSWTVGTQLAGDEGYGETVIMLTSIGESNIMARAISHNGELLHSTESMWTLQHRDWRAI